MKLFLRVSCLYQVRSTLFLSLLQQIQNFRFKCKAIYRKTSFTVPPLNRLFFGTKGRYYLIFGSIFEKIKWPFFNVSALVRKKHFYFTMVFKGIFCKKNCRFDLRTFREFPKEHQKYFILH